MAERCDGQLSTQMGRVRTPDNTNALFSLPLGFKLERNICKIPDKFLATTITVKNRHWKILGAINDLLFLIFWLTRWWSSDLQV